MTPYEVYFLWAKWSKGRACERVEMKVKWRKLIAGDSLYITHCHIYNHLFCEQMIWGMLPWWGNNRSQKATKFSYNISAAQCLWMDICSLLCCVLSVLMLNTLASVVKKNIGTWLSKVTCLVAPCKKKYPGFDILETGF